MGKSSEFLLQRIGSYDLCGTNLGKGAFARVELALHRLTNTKVAMKIIDLDTISESYVGKNILRESAILKNLRHENIVNLYETLAYRSTYCFVMEYLSGGDLQNYVSSQKRGYLSEIESRRIFVQILSAVRYLHSKGIIHRDLKMQNIMLTEDKKKIKLVDFGLSNFFNQEDLLQTKCGSAEYAAPELFEKEKPYGPAVEMWSIGVILFAMATGQMPFRARAKDRRENFIVQIRRGLNISHEANLKRITPGLKNLLSLLLEPDKEKRITLHKCLSNIWVTDAGKSPVLPTAPVNVPHEIRKKVIETVSNLYNRSVDETKQHLKANTYDSMDAAYQILLDKTYEFFKYNSHGSLKHKDKRSVSIPINLRCKGSARTRATRMSYRNIQSAPQETGGSAGSLRHPVASCLQISKKSACNFSTKSTSPSFKYASTVDSNDDLKQTPFRLSPPVGNQNHKRKPKSPRVESRQKKTESNLIETTLEGVFEVNNSQSNVGEDSSSNQVEIASNQIRVSFNGEGLKSGSFKITEKTRNYTEAEYNSKDLDEKKHECMNRCSRCLSPYEARRMLHRDTFPLKKTTMKPAQTVIIRTHRNGKLYTGKKFDQFESKTMCRAVSADECIKNSNGHTEHFDIVPNIISTPDSILRLNSSKDRYSSASSSPYNKFTIQDAEEILSYEKRKNRQNIIPLQQRLSNHSKDIIPLQQRLSNHSKDISPKRKVSFKE